MVNCFLDNLGLIPNECYKLWMNFRPVTEICSVAQKVSRLSHPSPSVGTGVIA